MESTRLDEFQSYEFPTLWPFSSCQCSKANNRRMKKVDFTSFFPRFTSLDVLIQCVSTTTHSHLNQVILLNQLDCRQCNADNEAKVQKVLLLSTSDIRDVNKRDFSL